VGRSGEIIACDVITAVNDRPVESVARLRARLDDFPVGRRVTLDVWRQGRTVRLQVALEAE
jgi:S1-C subfamily serine protease